MGSSMSAIRKPIPTTTITTPVITPSTTTHVSAVSPATTHVSTVSSAKPPSTVSLLATKLGLNNTKKKTLPNLGLRQGEISLFFKTCITDYNPNDRINADFTGIIAQKADNVKLNEGIYNIKEDILSMGIGPNTRVTMKIPGYMGEMNISFDESMEGYLDCNNAIRIGTENKDFFKQKNKIIIVSKNKSYNNAVGNKIEKFNGQTISNTCHYVCSNINMVNIIVLILIIILVYYYTGSYFNKN